MNSLNSSPKLEQLRHRWAEIDDLRSAASLLHWDQATYMPQGGAQARGRQLGTLSRLAHERLTSPELGAILDALGSLPDDSPDAALVRVAQRRYDKAVRVPNEFEARLSDHLATTYQAWTRARPDNDFSSVRPLLEQTLELSREYASFFPHQHIADPLIDDSDPGMTVALVRPLFAQLRAQLVPLVEAVTAQPIADDSLLKQHFPRDAQLAFCRQIAGHIGYDFHRGRLDLTPHPFMTKFSLGDVRITNRVDEGDLQDALFGTLHESGHALYEQGIASELEATPLSEGASSGVHESQSRLWENLVGRSRAFWTFWWPQLQSAFPLQLGSADFEAFYRAMHRVQRSLIRTDSDELTYNLHVMIRFDLECDLLEGKLAVRDLPEAWRARYQSDLGVSSPDDRDGCLQDVHWFGGTIGGAFQGYTLGNILSAQIWDTVHSALPDLESQIARGDTAQLLAWLQQNLYRFGATYLPNELIQRATGRALTIEPYMAYLKSKYGALYGI